MWQEGPLYANKCTDEDGNDKSSTRSSIINRSSTTAGLTALDGVASMMVSHYSKPEA
jgi:hypothetical protein